MRKLLLAALLLGGAGAAPGADDAPADDAQDLVFLGEARPAFIRIHVRNADGSAFAGYDAFFARLYRFLDRDGSGSLSRAEAARMPTVTQITSYLNGIPYITTAPARPGMMAPAVKIEDLDADRDGRVTPEELREHYRSNGVGALTVSNQTAFAGSAETYGLLLLNALDSDRDGKLSRSELRAAEVGLMRLDQDDDELISAAELGTPVAMGGRPVVAGGAMMPRPGRPEPKFGLELIPRGDRRLSAKMDAARKVLERYDANKDGRLTGAEVGLPQAVFAKADRNRDGKLDTLEVGRWLTGTPDLERTVLLAAPASAPPRGPTGGESLTMGNVQLSVIGQPANSGRTFDYKSQVLSQFRTFDVDRVGYLTRKQVDTRTGAFMRSIMEFADRNDDGRMSRDELVEYLDLVASGAMAQVSLTLSSSGQGLFEALDSNGDGHLGVREMRDAWARLGAFDRDGDGAVGQSELPSQVRLTVGRGAGSRGGFFPGGGVAPATRRLPTRGPLWFRKMDRNGDGDVSRGEWLGSAGDFDRADVNKDGLVGLVEAEALDAKLRR